MDGQRRLTQITANERLLREANEEIEREAREDAGPGARREETELEFFCACGRPECDVKLLLTLAQYEAATRGEGRFVVAPGHEVRGIDRVVEKHATYFVVFKDDDT